MKSFSEETLYIYIYQRILKMKEREKKGKKQTFSFELFGTPAILRNTLQN